MTGVVSPLDPQLWCPWPQISKVRGTGSGGGNEEIPVVGAFVPNLNNKHSTHSIISGMHDQNFVNRIAALSIGFSVIDWRAVDLERFYRHQNTHKEPKNEIVKHLTERNYGSSSARAPKLTIFIHYLSATHNAI